MGRHTNERPTNKSRRMNGPLAARRRGHEILFSSFFNFIDQSKAGAAILAAPVDILIVGHLNKTKM